MKIKKYQAASMPEAMKMIRSELGQDAVILNSKEVERGGFFGFFSKKRIEVIAAIDPHPAPREQMVKHKIVPTMEKQAETMAPKHDLKQDITELKSLIRNLNVNQAGSLHTYPKPIQIAYDRLVGQEISPHLRDDVVESLLAEWSKHDQHVDIDDMLKTELSHRLTKFSFGGIDYRRPFVNVVGPTGVGKTTTIAKMAAISMLQHQKKVAFITTDTYRIGAIEQLKTYAEILNVPVTVAYNLEDFKQAKQSYASYDLVLIDTAGRNFRNSQYIQDLHKIIDFDEEMETFLCLSLSAKLADMDAIVNQFSKIRVDKFIFTKADETVCYGAMYELIVKYQTGVAYVTNGQNVPDDLIEASPDMIVKTMFGA